jgi:hypothetical protein
MAVLTDARCAVRVKRVDDGIREQEVDIVF